MAKRSTSKVDLDDAAVKAILATLLADFNGRKLSAEDLHEGYEGPAPKDLKEACMAGGQFSEVDYDLAYKSLISANLVNTGPLEPYENGPNSYVGIIGLFSKEDWMYLTETGYQAAGRLRGARPQRLPATTVNISGGTFHNSPIGVGQHVSQELNFWSSRELNRPHA